MKLKKLLLIMVLMFSFGSVIASDEVVIEVGKTTINELKQGYGEPKQTVTIEEVDLLIYPYDDQHDLTFTFSNEVLVEYQLAKWDIDGEVTVTPIN
jgi:hypothetical protein